MLLALEAPLDPFQGVCKSFRTSRNLSTAHMGTLTLSRGTITMHSERRLTRTAFRTSMDQPQLLFHKLQFTTLTLGKPMLTLELAHTNQVNHR